MRLILHLFWINVLLICTTQAQNKAKVKISAKEWQNETLILEKTDQHFIPEYYIFMEIPPGSDGYEFELEKADFYNIKINAKSYGIHLQPGFSYQLTSANGKLEVESNDPLSSLLSDIQVRFEEFQKKNLNIIGNRKKNYDANYKAYVENIQALAEVTALTDYAAKVVYFELKRFEFNTLESAAKFKDFESEIIGKGLSLENRSFITFVNEIYPQKINKLRFRESNIPPSRPTLYFLDEAKYVPNDTLQQLVELVTLNELLYGSYTFEPNDSLIDSTLDKILTQSVDPSILEFAQLLDAKMNQLKTGENIPDFKFDLLNQPERKLSDYKGNYVLLDFWFSGCTPCLKAVPKLNAFDNENENLFIIGIDPVDTKEKFMKAIGKFGINYAQTLVDHNSELPSYFNVGGYPTYILIDPEGRYVNEFNSTSLDKVLSYIK